MADEESPRIIIDEDWKSRVEREREEARKGRQEGARSKPEDEKAASPFDGLVGYMASHAMAAMGMMAPADAEKVPVNLGVAQFVINSLMALRDKTKGNLTPEEEGNLTEMLANLQRAFVACSQAVHESALRGSAPGPDIQKPLSDKDRQG